jgi:hypothetical protein
MDCPKLYIDAAQQIFNANKNIDEVERDIEKKVMHAQQRISAYQQLITECRKPIVENQDIIRKANLMLSTFKMCDIAGCNHSTPHIYRNSRFFCSLPCTRCRSVDHTISECLITEHEQHRKEVDNLIKSPNLVFRLASHCEIDGCIRARSYDFGVGAEPHYQGCGTVCRVTYCTFCGASTHPSMKCELIKDLCPEELVRLAGLETDNSNP